MKTEIVTLEREKALEALEESERRYRRLLAATTDYIYSVKVENGMSGPTSHGPGCEAVTGYTSAEFAADSFLWYRIIHEDDRPAVLAQVELIFRDQAPAPLEHRILHKDGRVRWIRNTTIPHKDDEGRLRAYDGLITDITNQKRAEQSLNLQYTIARHLTESPNPAEALPLVLRALCLGGLWCRGTYWTYEAPEAEFRLTASWKRRGEENPATNPPARLPAGVGLPGRVLHEGRPVWLPDAEAEPELMNATLPSARGWRCACAFPVGARGTVLGVIELHGREVRQPDPDMQEVLVTVGVHLGLFLIQKRWEETLHRERNLLRTVIDNLPDSIFVKDTAGRFILDNPTHASLLGAAGPAEVLGRMDEDFVSQELAARYRADEELVLRTGEPLANREEPVVDTEGKKLWFLTTKVPLKGDKGEVAGVVGIAHDITDRRKAEEALRRSEERLKLVIQGSNDGIWDWNLATNESYFSPRWKSMLGYADHEVENNYSGWIRLMHPDDLDRALACLDSYLSGQTASYELEHRLRHKDGGYRWVLARGVALRDSRGVPVRMAGSHVDLTERKHVAERLEDACRKLGKRDRILRTMVRRLRASHQELKAAQAQLIQAAKLEAVGTLAAGVAHEVKNPLQTILMGLHYLRNRTAPADSELALTIGDMRDAVERANLIIRELLALSSTNAFEARPEDLNEVIRRALHLTNNELVAAHVNVEQEFSPDLDPVLIDSTHIEQVFLNLFINAIQAMPKGGVLTVRTRPLQLDEALVRQPAFRNFRPGDRLAVAEVQDTGDGIPETNINRVFDPFFSTKPVGAGTGLGLFVVRRILDMHRGVIVIQNVPAGGVIATVALRV